jgi:hypothetical protein
MNGVGHRFKAFGCKLHRDLEPMIVNGLDSGSLSLYFSELSSWANVTTPTKAINTADNTKCFTLIPLTPLTAAVPIAEVPRSPTFNRGC